jgi:uncharacterized Zn-binding protein involved in type VI secretion
MPTVARVGQDNAGGGVQLGSGNSFVTSDGALIAVLGDRVAPHPSGRPHRNGATMVGGSSFVTIDGIPICRAGDPADCGHSTTGSGVLSSE